MELYGNKLVITVPVADLPVELRLNIAMELFDVLAQKGHPMTLAQIDIYSDWIRERAK